MQLKIKNTIFFIPLNQVPNLLTILRMILVIPICLFLVNKNFFWASILFAIAAISDALDGFIAKKFNFSSYFGSILDPLADKLLLSSSFIIMTYLGAIPLWLCIIVIIRDIAIIAAMIGYFLVSHHKQIKPSIASKINTLFQILLVLFVLIDAQMALNDNLKNLIIFIVAASTIISGFDYAITWIKSAYKNVLNK